MTYALGQKHRKMMRQGLTGTVVFLVHIALFLGVLYWLGREIINEKQRQVVRMEDYRAQ